MAARLTLRNVRRDGHGGSLQLADEPESFGGRKALGDSIDFLRQINPFPPNDKVPISLDLHLPLLDPVLHCLEHALLTTDHWPLTTSLLATDHFTSCSSSISLARASPPQSSPGSA